ncbi:MAG: hypothetical protein K6F25_05770 [Bacteroidales bacterium]|nr:hypothetical protein [Bacteroidales bacterium]
MEPWEEIIINKLSGGEKALPDGSLAEFHSKLDMVSNAPARKRSPFAWVMVAAVAAVAAVVLILRLPAIPEGGINTADQSVDPVAVVDASPCIPESLEAVIRSYFQAQPLYAPVWIKKIINDNGYAKKTL